MLPWHQFAPLHCKENAVTCNQSTCGTPLISNGRHYVSKPTGLSRAQLWQRLFVTKHRQNPYQQREYQGADKAEVWNRWYEAQNYIDAYRVVTHPFSVNVEVAIAGFNIDNRAAKNAISDAKAWHARRWQTKEGTYRLKKQLLPDVRGQRCRHGRCTRRCKLLTLWMVVQLWTLEHYSAMLGHLELTWLLAGVQHMRALRMSHCLTLFHFPWAPAVWVVGLLFGLCWGFCLVVLFCKCLGVLGSVSFSVICRSR